MWRILDFILIYQLDHLNMCSIFIFKDLQTVMQQISALIKVSAVTVKLYERPSLVLIWLILDKYVYSMLCATNASLNSGEM